MTYRQESHTEWLQLDDGADLYSTNDERVQRWREAGYIVPQGRGGFGSKAREPHEDPNTLQSNAVMRMLLAVGEGPLGGLVNRFDSGTQHTARSIFFDKTPLMNVDGSYNFKGVTYTTRNGDPSQPVIPGFSKLETIDEIGAELVKDTPLTYISDAADTDAIRLVMRLPMLQYIDDQGDQIGTEVQFKVEVKNQNQLDWQDRGTWTIQGKTTSEYEIAYRIERPVATHTQGWQIRITRITPDSDSNKMSNQTYIGLLISIKDHEYTYPNTALLGVTVSMQQFGDQIPVVSANWWGKRVRIPNNFDPITGVYTGTWNGEYLYASGVSDPVWHLLDIWTSPISRGYGMGLDESFFDRYLLYEISRYNNERVGPSGEQIRRFGVNSVIDARDLAWNWVQTIASSMRAIVYWSAGAIRLSQDSPKTPSRSFGNSSVKDTLFQYSGTEASERITRANVTWNDPDDFYAPRLASYEATPEQIAQFGYNEHNVNLFGCTLEQRAIMYARWIVETSLRRTERVQFITGYEGADLAPGEIIEIYDRNHAGVEKSGRIATGSTTTTVVFDRPIELDSGHTYEVTIQLIDGTLQTRNISTAAGVRTSVTVLAAFTETPSEGRSFWVKTTLGDVTGLKPRPFVVTKNKQEDDASWNIEGIFWDKTLLPFVEEGEVIPPDVFSNIDLNTLSPVSNLQMRIVNHNDAVSGPLNDLLVRWSKSPSRYVTGYRVEWRKDLAPWRNIGVTPLNEVFIDDVVEGFHEVRVYAQNVNGRESIPVQGSYTFVYGGSSDVVFPPSSIQIVGGGLNWKGKDADFVWTNPTENNNRVLSGWRVEIYNAEGTVLRRTVNLPPSETRFIYTFAMNQSDGITRRIQVRVFAVDPAQRLSTAQVAILQNPAPAVPSGLIVSAGFTNIRIAYNQPSDPDWLGVRVHLSTTSGYIPNYSTIAYEGPGLNLYVPAATNTTYYIVVELYDEFGPYELERSGEIVERTLDMNFEVKVPGTPGLPNLDSRVEQTATGEQVILIVTWTGTTDARDYDVWVESATTFLMGKAAHNEAATGNIQRFETPVLPSYTYSVKLRAWADAVTPWGPTATFTTAKDETAPAAPTALAARPSFRSIVLTWVNPDDSDLDHIEIWRNSTNNSGTATKVGDISSTMFVDNTVVNNINGVIQVYYYWIKAVDRSGNASGFSTGVNTTPFQLVSEDLADAAVKARQIDQGAIDATKFASTIKPIVVVDVLPENNPASPIPIGSAVYLKSNGQLYNWNGTAWATPAPVDLSDIPGVITGTSIEQNSIDTGHLRANAVTTNKLLVASIGGSALNTDPQTLDASAWANVTANPFHVTTTGLATGTGPVKALAPVNAEDINVSPVSRLIPIDPTKNYRITATLWRSSGARNASLIAAFYNSTGVDVKSVSAATGGTTLIPDVTTGLITAVGTDGNATQAPGWLAYGNYHYWSIYNAQPPTTPTKYTINIGPTATAAPNNTKPGAITARIPPKAKGIRIGALLSPAGSTGINMISDVAIHEMSGATLIEEGAIYTQHLTANSVTLGKVAAAAIGVDQLAANAVTADKIKANAISTKAIAIGDFDNQIPNGYFDIKFDATPDENNKYSYPDWFPYGTTNKILPVIQYSDALPFTNYVFLSGGGAGQAYRLDSHGEGAYDSNGVDGSSAVRPGMKLDLELYHYTGDLNWSAAAGPPAIYVYWFGNDKKAGYTRFNLPASPSWTVWNVAGKSGAYMRTDQDGNNDPEVGVSNNGLDDHTDTKNGLIVPTGANRFIISLYMHAGTTGVWGVANVRAQRKTGITLIEDGSVTTDTIVAGSIRGINIDGGTITGDHIASKGSIEAPLGSISGLHIKGGTVDGTHITATGTITGAHLDTHTIDTDHITTGGLTASYYDPVTDSWLPGAIAAGTISAANISVTGEILTNSIQIAEGMIVKIHIGELQVDNGHFANLTLGTGKIGANAVSAMNTVTSAVTRSTNGQIVSATLNTIGGPLAIIAMVPIDIVTASAYGYVTITLKKDGAAANAWKVIDNTPTWVPDNDTGGTWTNTTAFTLAPVVSKVTSNGSITPGSTYDAMPRVHAVVNELPTVISLDVTFNNCTGTVGYTTLTLLEQKR